MRSRTESICGRGLRLVLVRAPYRPATFGRTAEAAAGTAWPGGPGAGHLPGSQGGFGLPGRPARLAKARLACRSGLRVWPAGLVREERPVPRAGEAWTDF
ncbi:protein of unknown function [Agreia sp. COWG]|nr:protein of unknown function [Agreia sp. COWG]